MENTSGNLPTHTFLSLSRKLDCSLCPEAWYLGMSIPFSDAPFHRLILKLYPENKNKGVTAAFSDGL